MSSQIDECEADTAACTHDDDDVDDVNDCVT